MKKIGLIEKAKKYYQLPEIKNVVKASIVFFIFLCMSGIYIWTLREDIEEEVALHRADNKRYGEIVDSLEDERTELYFRNTYLEMEIEELKNNYSISIEKIKELEISLTSQRNYYANEKKIIQHTNNTDSQLEFLSRLFIDNRRLFSKLYAVSEEE